MVNPAVHGVSRSSRAWRLSLALAFVALVVAAPAAQARWPSPGAAQDLRAKVQAAMQRTFGATAPDGFLSAASHECVGLVIDCNDAGVGSITTHDCPLDSGGYFDIVFFSAVAGQTIQADLSSFDFDPLLALFDPDVNLVASDDDSGPGQAARIVYLIDETSNLWALAVFPLFNNLGDYLLSLQCSQVPSNTPAAPSNLVAQAQSPTQVRLTWNDNSNNETSFRVETRTSGSGFGEIGSVGANTTSATITDLQPGSTVDFRVRARNSNGNSAYSNVATVTLPTGGGTQCVAGPRVLCLANGRFQVQVDFSTTQGGGSSGTANVIPLAGLGVDRGGLFTFFNTANPEMLLKILNGCPVNGRWWVFFAATTNVGFEVRVTDTQTGATWTRFNSDGNPAAPVQDTSAFATCP